jgi:NAD(P)H-dependent FMN reductase
MPTRILVIPGSLRRGSFARQLARAAADLAVAGGAVATLADLRDLEMPLYDGDLEDDHGLPSNAVALRRLVQQHDALLVVTPEYNASIPAVLKNALDWVSRPYAQEPGVSAFRGKTAALLASSPGALGGLRALVHLRQVLMNLGVLVLTEQYALGGANSAFGASGELVDDKHRTAVGNVVSRLVAVAGKLAS